MLAHYEGAHIKVPLKYVADKLQADATIDKNAKRKAIRTKAMQSLLRLAQSSTMRKLAEHGD